MNSSPRAQEKLVFQSSAGKIYYQPTGYVRLAWAQERIAFEHIQAYYEQVLALLQSTDVRRILSDHGQRAPLPAEAQQWLIGDWIPRAMHLTNTHHCAIVEGANPMHRLSTQSIVSMAPSGFVFKRFDSIEPAETWLLGLDVKG
jgi:hypothetical protein